MSSNGLVEAKASCASARLDESGNLWPSIRVGLEVCIRRVAEEACDRNVGESELAEQPAGLGQLAFEIVESGRSILR